jgi:hypothetical protein
METLSDLEDEHTMLLHNIGTVHPMTWSHPKKTASYCVLTDKSRSILQAIQSQYLLRPTNPVKRTACNSDIIHILDHLDVYPW